MFSKENTVKTHRRRHEFVVISVVIDGTDWGVHLVFSCGVVNKLILVDHVVTDDVVAGDVTGCVTLVDCSSRQQQQHAYTHRPMRIIF